MTRNNRAAGFNLDFYDFYDLICPDRIVIGFGLRKIEFMIWNSFNNSSIGFYNYFNNFE